MIEDHSCYLLYVQVNEFIMNNVLYVFALSAKKKKINMNSVPNLRWIVALHHVTFAIMRNIESQAYLYTNAMDFLGECSDLLYILLLSIHTFTARTSRTNSTESNHP